MVAAPTRPETADGVKTYGNYINGEWRPAASEATTENRSPADHDDLVGRFAASDREDANAAIGAATDAFPAWRFTSALTRANILHKAANILEGRIQDIGRELTREEGKTLKEGIGETTRAVQILRYYAGEAQQPSGEHYPSMSPTTLLYTLREPLGPIATRVVGRSSCAGTTDCCPATWRCSGCWSRA